MKSEEYPSNVILAQGIGKALGRKIEPDVLRIQNEMAKKVELEIIDGLKCDVRYHIPLEKSGKVTVTLTPKTGKPKTVIKEFDTELEDDDIENIDAYSHRLPILAFKSAIGEILKSK